MQAMSTERRDVLFDGSSQDCQLVIITNEKRNDVLREKRRGNFSQAEIFLWSGSGVVFSFESGSEMLELLGDKGVEFLSRLRMFYGQPIVKELKAAVEELEMKLGKVKIGGFNLERLCGWFLGNVQVWWESRNKDLHKGHNILHQAVSRVRLEPCLDQTLKDNILELEFQYVALLVLKMQLVQLKSMVHIVSSDSSLRLTLIANGFNEISQVREIELSLAVKFSWKTKASKIWIASRNSAKQTIEKHLFKFSVLTIVDVTHRIAAGESGYWRFKGSVHCK